MDFGEMGWGVICWIDVAQDRGQWRVLVNCSEPPDSNSILEIVVQLSD
jgi:hypothetical protein